MDKKDTQGVFVYISTFLLISYTFMLLAAPYLYLIIPNICKPDIKMCGFLEIGLFYLFSWLLKLVVPIWGSFYIIRKSNNKILKSIYDNFLIPTILLICCVCYDYFARKYLAEGYYYDTYNSILAVTPAFLVVYTIAIINTIKLRFFKKPI